MCVWKWGVDVGFKWASVQRCRAGYCFFKFEVRHFTIKFFFAFRSDVHLGAAFPPVFRSIFRSSCLILNTEQPRPLLPQLCEVSYLTCIFGWLLTCLLSPLPWAPHLRGFQVSVGQFVSLSLQTVNLIFSLWSFISSIIVFAATPAWLFLIVPALFFLLPLPSVLFPAFQSGLSFISFFGRCRENFVSFWPISFFSSSKTHKWCLPL